MPTAAAYLLIALTGGIVARSVRLPPLVGFLAAGYVVHGLGLPELPGLEVAADLGVVLLLFTIGLRIEVRTLLRTEVWGTALVHAGASLVCGTVLLAVLGRVGVAFLGREEPAAFVLIAFALAFSSTVFVVKALDARGESESLYGRIAVGVLVIQDLLAVGFIAASHGHAPSVWAFALLGLIPARRLLWWVWDRVGHNELQAVFGLAVALGPGFVLFEAVGLRGDLGALVMGMLLAPHRSAGELSRHLFALKEVLLVGFFVAIGVQGPPTGDLLVVAVILLVLLPVKVAGYVALLSWARLRRRTALLAGAALANYSEFALIVAAVGVSAGLLDRRWLGVLSVTVAGSFVVSAVVNARAVTWVNWIEARLPRQPPERIAEHDRPIDVGHADAVVFGLGRVGQGAYERLSEERGLVVVGFDQDEERLAPLTARGFDVLHADATDGDFWARVTSEGTVRMAVLALPRHVANLAAAEQLRASNFTGRIAAVARYDDEVAALRELDIHPVNLYAGAGAELADRVLDEA